MSFFEINKTYRDRGTNYKRFEDDRFTSKLVDSSDKTIPHIGGMRFKEFNNIQIKVPTKIGTYVKPYIVLISASINTEFENPWTDELSKNRRYLKFWGDAKGKKRPDKYPGNKVMSDSYFLTKKARQIAPPILHFSKDKIGFVRFNGICVIENMSEDSFEYQGRKIKNYLFNLSVLNETKVPTEWLIQRVDAVNVNDVDLNFAPKCWLNFTSTGFVDLYEANKKSKKILTFDEDKLTVIMWICLHKGFSTFDDSSASNKEIASVFNVKQSSLDMYARHIKFHCFRLDLYGKKPRGGKRVADIVDTYRTDQRKLVKAAKQIAEKNGWNDKLKKYL